MFHPDLIAAEEEKLLKVYGTTLPEGRLVRYSVADRAEQTRRLANARPAEKGGPPARALTVDEEAFITNERLLTKVDYEYWATGYCNPVEAPVWMGDFSFKPIGDVQVGDTVIGWTRLPVRQKHLRRKHPERRPSTRVFTTREYFVRSTVLGVSHRRAQVVRVLLSSGRTIRCTADHLWSEGRGEYRQRRPWIHATKGAVLRRMIEPFPVCPAEQVRTAAWLGGLYDGEGTGTTIAQYAEANPVVYAAIGAALGRLGFSYTPTRDRQAYGITGGRSAYSRFLSWCQPVKSVGLEHMLLAATTGQPDVVVAVEPDGEAEVVGLQTTTGNYTAWGYGSKNCWINKQPEGLGRLFPLWGSQRIALDEIARLELDRVKTGHPDGILVLFLKARQLGLSTLWESILCHRLTTQTYQRGLIAGDVPEQSEYLFSMLELIEEHLPWWLTPEIRFFNKGKFRFWENFSSARVLAGKSQRGALQDKGGSKGNIGRGKTFGLGHLSEISTWEHPDQLDDGFEPGVPESRRSLVGYESTAKGRNDYWHNKWRKADQGIGRFVPVFIGWWAEPAKYWRPVTDAWEPKPTTLEHAQLVEREGPRWVHHEVRLTKEQLYWYEQKRADFEADDDLATFLSEYPAAPEEAFQFAGRSIFSESQISRIRAASKPLQVVLDVKPAREIVQGARIEAEIAARVAARQAELAKITGEGGVGT